MTSDIPRWRKSSYSGGQGGNCIEAADHAGRILVRDSTDRQGPVLRFGSAAWRIFTARLKTSS
jgi:Domain of unknown function (DUF397)